MPIAKTFGRLCGCVWSYLYKHVGERDHRSQTGLDPPHSTKRTFPGVAVDTATVSRMVLRMAVPLGYSSAAGWLVCLLHQRAPTLLSIVRSQRQITVWFSPLSQVHMCWKSICRIGVEQVGPCWDKVLSKESVVLFQRLSLSSSNKWSTKGMSSALLQYSLRAAEGTSTPCRWLLC